MENFTLWLIKSYLVSVTCAAYNGFNGHNCPDEEGGYVSASMTEYLDKNGKVKNWNGPTINKKTTYYRICIRKKAGV